MDASDAGMRRLEARALSKPWGQARVAGAGGAMAGQLGRLWTADIGRLGEIWFEPEAGQRPALLLKLLFTSERLSVQVHPDANAAAALGLPSGKDEAWYVLSAETGAMIGLGLPHAEPGTDLRAAALDGRIIDMMDWVPVEAGDVFYVPGGTVHALGAGLVLAEIQENVDVTWRLHDYGRNRPLHLDEGLSVARRSPGPSVSRKPAGAPGRHIRTSGGQFVLEEWMGPMSARVVPGPGGPLWLLPLTGATMLEGVSVQPGEACMIDGPVDVQLEGALLVAYVGGMPRQGLLEANGARTLPGDAQAAAA